MPSAGMMIKPHSSQTVQAPPNVEPLVSESDRQWGEFVAGRIGMLADVTAAFAIRLARSAPSLQLEIDRFEALARTATTEDQARTYTYCANYLRDYQREIAAGQLRAAAVRGRQVSDAA